MKRYIGRGPQQRSFCPWCAWGLAQGHTEAFFFPNMKALQKGPRSCPFWVFMEASLHSHDWLNHWLKAMDSTSSPSMLPRNEECEVGSGTESSNPLNMGSVLLATSSTLGWDPNVTFPEVFSGREDKKPNIPLLLSFRKFQGFWELWARNCG